MKKKLEEELDELVGKMEAFISVNSPGWLTPNSTSVGIRPGHNLDLLQISFDFRVDRSEILKSETPDVLKDPSKPDLKVIT